MNISNYDNNTERTRSIVTQHGMNDHNKHLSLGLQNSPLTPKREVDIMRTGVDEYGFS